MSHIHLNVIIRPAARSATPKDDLANAIASFLYVRDDVAAVLVQRVDENGDLVFEKAFPSSFADEVEREENGDA